MTETRGHIRLVTFDGCARVADKRVFVSRKGDGVAFDVGAAGTYDLDVLGFEHPRGLARITDHLRDVLVSGAPAGAIDAASIREVKTLGLPQFWFAADNGRVLVGRWWVNRAWSDADEAQRLRDEARDAAVLVLSRPLYGKRGAGW